MADFVTETLYQITFFINHADNGWSESWYLLAQFEDDAFTDAADLLEARWGLLAENHVIEWCELKRLQPPRAVHAAIDDPLEPLATWGPSHDDTVGLLFRFQAQHGKFSNHLIRAIDDSEIENNHWLRHNNNALLTGGPRPADMTLATKAELFAYFVGTFRDLTCHREQLEDTPGGQAQWRLRSWDNIIFRHVSTGAYGSRYDRVSAEWADWTYGAEFSYCGVVCGVQRTCRAVITHPYIGGPPMVLRFYFAEGGAATFNGWTIFFGTYRDKEIDGNDTPGEQKGPQYSVAQPAGTWQYSPGFSYGSAPGIAPTGTAADFLGLGIKPWPDVDDLEPHQGAACDMPVFSFTVADTNPNTIIVPNCMQLDFENADFVITQTAPGFGKVQLRNTGFPTGSGTAGRVPVWVTNTQLGDSTAADNSAAFTFLKRIASPKFVVTVPTDDETTLAIGDHTAAYLDGPSFLNTVRGLNTGYDGEWKFLFFRTNGFLLKHDDPAGNIGGKIDCSFVGNDVFFPAGSAAILFYDQAAAKWKLLAGPEADRNQSGTVSLADQQMGQGKKTFDRIRADGGINDGLYENVSGPHEPEIALEGSDICGLSMTAPNPPGSTNHCTIEQNTPELFGRMWTGYGKMELSCQELDVIGNSVYVQIDPYNDGLMLLKSTPTGARYGVDGTWGASGTTLSGDDVRGGIITNIGTDATGLAALIFALLP